MIIDIKDRCKKVSGEEDVAEKVQKEEVKKEEKKEEKILSEEE